MFASYCPWPRCHSTQLYVKSLLVRESLKKWSCWGSIRKYSKRPTVRGIRAALKVDPAVIPTHSPPFPSSPENQLSPTRWCSYRMKLKVVAMERGAIWGGSWVWTSRRSLTSRPVKAKRVSSQRPGGERRCSFSCHLPASAPSVSPLRHLMGAAADRKDFFAFRSPTAVGKNSGSWRRQQSPNKNLSLSSAMELQLEFWDMFASLLTQISKMATPGWVWLLCFAILWTLLESDVPKTFAHFSRLPWNLQCICPSQRSL